MREVLDSSAEVSPYGKFPQSHAQIRHRLLARFAPRKYVSKLRIAEFVQRPWWRHRKIAPNIFRTAEIQLLNQCCTILELAIRDMSVITFRINWSYFIKLSSTVPPAITWHFRPREKMSRYSRIVKLCTMILENWSHFCWFYRLFGGEKTFLYTRWRKKQIGEQKSSKIMDLSDKERLSRVI